MLPCVLICPKTTLDKNKILIATIKVNTKVIVGEAISIIVYIKIIIKISDIPKSIACKIRLRCPASVIIAFVR